MDPTTALFAAAFMGEPAADPADALRVDLAAEAWLPRLEGQFTDNGADVDVRTLDVHDTEVSFAGALRLHRGDFHIELRGFSFATDGGTASTERFTLGGVTVDAGQRFTSGFSWWSAGASVSYDAYEPHPRGNGAPNATEFALFVLGSLDVQSVTRDIENLATGATASAKEGFVCAEFGGGLRLGFDSASWFPVFRRAEISTQLGVGISLPVGGGDFGGASRIEAQLTGYVTPNLAAYFGYRLVGASLNGEDLEMTTSLQGLRLGLLYEF